MELEPKERIDAWGADLPEKVRWDCYDLCRGLPWPKGVIDQLEAIGIQDDRLPRRTAWYNFLARMRKADAARRIDRIAQSVAEAQAVADRHGIKAAVFVETLKTLAIDKAMGGDDASATKLAMAAATIWDRAQKAEELKLKSRAQETRDAQLKLAREKFEAAERRLAAVQGAVDAPQLTDAERVAKIKSIFGMR